MNPLRSLWLRAVVVLLCASLMTGMFAGVAEMSAGMRLRLNPSVRQRAVQAPAHNNRMVDLWLTLSDTADVTRLTALGVRMGPPLSGGLRTAQVPQQRLTDVLRMPGIVRLAAAHRLAVCNDSARVLSGMEGVGTAATLPEGSTDYSLLPYTGRGVVIGMVDTGVDFGHINLLDEQGRRRVVAAYLPADTTGEQPVIGGETLPGSHYATVEAIAALTTDNPSGSHGTHTTGTAAGSYRANGYHGVAPEAVLVIAAMPDSALTDVNIANAVRYIFDYAEKAGMPAVVNMSLSSHEGAHDGTSELCRALDAMSGPGRICVLSAGNDGLRRMHMQHTFSGTTDTVRTCLASYTSNNAVRGYVSLWNRSAQPHILRLAVVDRNAGGAVLWRSEPIEPLSADSVASFSASDGSLPADCFTGEVQVANAVEDNGLYHTLMAVDAKSTDTRYCLALELTAPSGTRLDAWGDGSLLFAAHSLRGFRDGSKVGSISDLATGEQTISVGAYCSRRTTPLADGGTETVSRSVPGDIGYFSSYGPDARGTARPDLCAPGMSLVSSTSRYDMASRRLSWLGQVDGVEYGYRSIYGTSMSAPMVTGAVALLLQAGGPLSPDEVRKALTESAVIDGFVNTATGQWGAGKLHVGAALREVLASGIHTVVAEPGSLQPPVVSYRDGMLHVGCAGGLLSLTVTDMQGRVVARYRNTGATDETHIPLSLSRGIFVATAVLCNGATVSTKFVAAL